MSVDKSIQSKIAIAALLHDIGKFKQRAYEGNEAFILPESKKMDGQILPHSKDGRYTHRHALWTYDFFINDFKNITKSSDNKYAMSLKIEELAKLSAFHHNPATEEQRIIEQADKKSAGCDRFEQEEYKQGEYLRKPLSSILERTKLSHSESENAVKSEYAYELKRLNSEDSFVPKKNVELKTEDYRRLYNGFLIDLKESIDDIRNDEQLIRKLKDLMLEYTYCVPSATNDYLCDISLYDHSVTTMSIAIALLCNPKKETNFRICAFGISGIQSFIFQSKDESFRNAAKIFRGRSFIVSFLSSAFQKYLCDELDLIPFLDLMDVGGNITLILPNISGYKEKLKTAQEKIETFLLEKYHGTLAIVMDYSLVRATEDFGNKKFLSLRKEIGKKLSEQKCQKFKYALQKINPVFDDEMNGKLCPACGKHQIELENKELCELCYGQKIIGERIPTCKYFSLATGEGDYEILPNYYVSFFKDNETIKTENAWSLDGESVSSYPVWRLNNYTPNLDFEDIAKKSVSWEGYGKAFLSYVKIDVDSLGLLIDNGVRGEEYSVSRFCSISRTLHHFFNTYVYMLLRNNYPYAYTVLSGGDDLFLIMPWNQTLDFIERLKDEFAKFVSFNDDIHFSVGVVIAGKKEPFALVNKKANYALDYEAKNMEDKNAISYLGTNFKLNQLSSLLEDYNYFKGFVSVDESDNKVLSTSFVYRLYKYVCDILSPTSSFSQRYSVYSKIHYDIARNIKVSEDNNGAEAIKFILSRFNNYSSVKELELFRLILIQTLYELRKTDLGGEKA